MEDTNVIPMDQAMILSEAGRFGVLVRLLKDDFRNLVGRDAECEGFYEVFSFLYALLDEISVREDLLSSLPSMAYQVYCCKRVTCAETEVMYRFPETSDSLTDLAILYCAYSHSIGGDEIPLVHLPYLFSMAPQIATYVHAGFDLCQEADELVSEVKDIMERRAKPNQNELYLLMESRLKEVFQHIN